MHDARTQKTMRKMIHFTWLDPFSSAFLSFPPRPFSAPHLFPYCFYLSYCSLHLILASSLLIINITPTTSIKLLESHCRHHHQLSSCSREKICSSALHNFHTFFCFPARRQRSEREREDDGRMMCVCVLRNFLVFTFSCVPPPWILITHTSTHTLITPSNLYSLYVKMRIRNFFLQGFTTLVFPSSLFSFARLSAIF